MQLSTLAFCAAVLAAVAAFAQDSGQGPRGFLTPEQRAMLAQEQPHPAWRSMTDQQRAAARDQMRAKWQAMSVADRQALKTRLQAEWSALPAAQKQAVEQKIADRRARWQQNGSGQ
ncbi:MAG: hypothetical protein ACREHE_05625 [Rhizomicrobium sp.]